MTEELVYHVITCPHCWEPNDVCIDTSAGDQTYIEDCTVCCHPIELQILIADGSVSVEALATQ